MPSRDTHPSSAGIKRNVIFLGGAVKLLDVERLKIGDLRRVAFAGRSNVGKSSLLNALTGMKVARVSSEPGKTREMNFYLWGLTNGSAPRPSREAWVLVDLPGYGYAKVAHKLRDQWGREITAWLKSDECLELVVVLVDGRHGLLANDMELVDFLKSAGLPFLVAFTKMDKWKSTNQRKQAERELSGVAAKAGVERFIFVSAQAKDGIRPLKEQLKDPAKLR